jgi:hypothetical protein
MKSRYALMAAAALAATALIGCSGGYSAGNTYTPSMPPPVAQSLDTPQVLAQAQQPSETSSPYQVADGALTLTDTSEDSEPISVDAKP